MMQLQAREQRAISNRQGRGDCGYSPIMLRLRSVGTTEAAATAATTMIRFYQCCTYILCSAAHAKVKGRTGRGMGGQFKFNSSNSKIRLTCKAKYLPYVVIVPPQADHDCTPFVERTNDFKYEKIIPVQVKAIPQHITPGFRVRSGV